MISRKSQLVHDSNITISYREPLSEFTLHESKPLDVSLGKALSIILNFDECLNDSHIETQASILKLLSEKIARGKARQVTNIKQELKEQFMLNFRFFFERNSQDMNSIFLSILSGECDKYYAFSVNLILGNLIKFYYNKTLTTGSASTTSLIVELDATRKINFPSCSILLDIIENYYLVLEKFVITIGKPSVLGVAASNNFLLLAKCYHELSDVCSNDETESLCSIASLGAKMKLMRPSIETSTLSVLNTTGDWFLGKRSIYTDFIKSVISCRNLCLKDEFYVSFYDSLIEGQDLDFARVGRLIDDAFVRSKELDSNKKIQYLSVLVTLLGHLSRLSVGAGRDLMSIYAEKLIALAKNLMLIDDMLISRWGCILWNDSRLSDVRKDMHPILLKEIWALLSEKTKHSNLSSLFGMIVGEVSREQDVASEGCKPSEEQDLAFEDCVQRWLFDQSNSTLTQNAVDFISFVMTQQDSGVWIGRKKLLVKLVCSLVSRVSCLEELICVQSLVDLVPLEMLSGMVADKLNKFPKFFDFLLCKRTDRKELVFCVFDKVCTSKDTVEEFYTVMSRWSKSIGTELSLELSWLPEYVEKTLESFYKHPQSCEFIRIITCQSPLFSRVPKIIFSNILGRLQFLREEDEKSGVSLRESAQNTLFSKLAPLLILNSVDPLAGAFEGYASDEICRVQDVLMEIMCNLSEISQIQKLAAEILGRLVFVQYVRTGQITPVYTSITEFLRNSFEDPMLLEKDRQLLVTCKTFVYVLCNAVAFYEVRAGENLKNIFDTITNGLMLSESDDYSKRLVLGCTSLVGLLIKCHILNGADTSNSLKDFNLTIVKLLFCPRTSSILKRRLSDSLIFCQSTLEDRADRRVLIRYYLLPIIENVKIFSVTSDAACCEQPMMTICSIVIEDRGIGIVPDVAVELLNLACSILTQSECIAAELAIEMLGSTIQTFPSLLSSLGMGFVNNIQNALKLASRRRSLPHRTQNAISVVCKILNSNLSSK